MDLVGTWVPNLHWALLLPASLSPSQALECFLSLLSNQMTSKSNLVPLAECPQVNSGRIAAVGGVRGVYYKDGLGRLESKWRQ